MSVDAVIVAELIAGACGMFALLFVNTRVKLGRERKLYDVLSAELGNSSASISEMSEELKKYQGSIRKWEVDRLTVLQEKALVDQEVARWRHEDALRARAAAYSAVELRPVEEVAKQIGFERAVYRNFLLVQVNYAMEKLLFEFVGRGFVVARTEFLVDATDSEGVVQVYFDRLPKRVITPVDEKEMRESVGIAMDVSDLEATVSSKGA